MGGKNSTYRGCLLGLAVGDAMGYAVDRKTWEQICRDYGPNGLLGYDLVNGYAEVTSHTQLTAVAANGLLMGTTRGQLQGKMAPFIRYVSVAVKEWNQTQHTRREPDRAYCWINRVPELRRRRCMDTRMLDTISRDRLGTLEEPVNSFSTPGMLTAAIAVGLYYRRERMKVSEVGRLGAEIVGLTHGEPMAFLSGAVLAYIITGVLNAAERPVAEHILRAADAVETQFGRQYPQAAALKKRIYATVESTRTGNTDHQQAMEQLGCTDCDSVLCGAVYAVLTCGGDFDTAMITAVNHSGASAAVGALCGAMLGAKFGEETLPEFYLECLDCVPVLRSLADDLVQGCPLDRSARLYDDDWDRKYLHGERIEDVQWDTEA